MARFAQDLDALVAQLDSETHATAIAALRRCRSLRELERLAEAGWLEPPGQEPRLKLVKHGSGTFIVVQYEQGWSTRLAMRPFPPGH